MAQYVFAPLDSNVTSVDSFGGEGSIQPPNPTLIPTETLLDPSVVHTFLIRTPEKAIPSYHRLCYPGTSLLASAESRSWLTSSPKQALLPTSSSSIPPRLATERSGSCTTSSRAKGGRLYCSTPRIC